MIKNLQKSLVSKSNIYKKKIAIVAREESTTQKEIKIYAKMMILSLIKSIITLTNNFSSITKMGKFHVSLTTKIFMMIWSQLMQMLLTSF